MVVTKKFTSVWTREARQPKASGLTREQIVGAAIEILDAEGLDSLSMRKLGAKLGAGATSVYWYVANKDELLELALDEAWNMPQVPDPDEASWREVMTTFAYSFRATLFDHHWAAALVGQMPSMGPNALKVADLLRRTFTSAGFHGMDIFIAGGVVMSFVLGQVIPELAYTRAFGDDADHNNVMDELNKVAGDYPELIADREDGPTDPKVLRAIAFDFGLQCVLDGLEVRLRNAVDAAASKP